MEIANLIILFLILIQDCQLDLNKRQESYSSSYSNELNMDTTVYAVVEKMPILKECKSEPDPIVCSKRNLIEFIFNNLEYRAYSKEDGIESTIVVSFIVEKDGSTSDLKVLKGADVSNIREVLSRMPQWSPGENKGDKKRVRMKIPIRVNWVLQGQ